MPSKEFVLDNGHQLVITKRRNSRNIKLTIDSITGRIKISQPYWVPYSAGLQFAKSKQLWIDRQVPDVQQFENDHLIGKNHRLKIVTSSVPKRTSITQTQITVYIDSNKSFNQLDYVKNEVEKHAPKALKRESSILLPVRVKHLSDKTGLVFNDLKFKKLKGRWGSCDQQKNITLNIYLIQLPWELIDYVILHELTHTKHLHHQKDFWNEMVKHMPDAKMRRKEMKNFKPQVFGS